MGHYLPRGVQLALAIYDFNTNEKSGQPKSRSLIFILRYFADPGTDSFVSFPV